MNGRREKGGLCECILGGRTDLRPGSDPDGKDKADAGKDHGASGMHGGAAWSYRRLPALRGVCRRRASVPLLGFGNVLMKGVKEAVEKEGFMGLFSGGFKAGAVGTSAALIFGYLASLVFNPKMKK